MGAEVLKFPAPAGPDLGKRKTELVFNFRQKPVLLDFNLEESKKLLAAAQKVRLGMDSLIEFIDSHRDDASRSGIETIAVELAQEKPALASVEDALEESVGKGEGVRLTDQAVALLRRLEKLLAEAGSNISRFTSRSISPEAKSPELGAIDTTPNYLTPAAIFFGVVAIGLIVVLLTPRD